MNYTIVRYTNVAQTLVIIGNTHLSLRKIEASYFAEACFSFKIASLWFVFKVIILSIAAAVP